MASAPPPPMPSRVGRYELLAPIASGGMASVFLARARGAGGFERDVALKLTHAHLRENPDFGSVLLEEAKLAGRIRHTHVVSILDVGEDPQGYFLVMDYVEGDTLHGLARKHLAERGATLPRGVGMHILLDALAGLHAAHELRGDDGAPLGVVHRDFSPQNLLVGTDGVAKLADFGIAKATSRGGQTATGIIKGKARYMSPEQARGRPVDRRCDVWAAGVVAWELLAGRKVHGNVEDVPLLLQIVTEPPPKLRAAGVDVSAELEAAVASALEMDVERRCPTAAELATRLSAAFEATDRLEEPARIGALVTELAGAKITARRAQVQVAVERTVALPTREDTRTSDRVAMTATIAETAEAETVAVDRTKTAPVRAAPAVEQALAPVRSTRKARWIWTAGAAAAVATVVTAALLRTGASRDAGATATVPPPPAPSSAASVAASDPPASSPDPPDPPAASTAPSAGPQATSTPTRSPSGARPVRPSAPAGPKPTAAPAPGKLAPPPW